MLNIPFFLLCEHHKIPMSYNPANVLYFKLKEQINQELLRIKHRRCVLPMLQMLVTINQNHLWDGEISLIGSCHSSQTNYGDEEKVKYSRYL